MDAKWIDKLAITTLERYEPTRLTGAIDVVMPGYFAGSDILFVAQNPGQLKKDVPEDQEYLVKYREFRKTITEWGKEPTQEQVQIWRSMMETYKNALRSPKGSLGRFVNDIYGEDWSNISITNVYKCPFLNNVIPTQVPNSEIQLLTLQVDAVKPDIIVYIGRSAREASMYQNYHPKTMHVQHPSFLMKRGSYEHEVQQIAAQLDNLRNVS